jgi:hypothetical protein
MKSATVGAEDIDMLDGIFGLEDDAVGSSPVSLASSLNQV